MNRKTRIFTLLSLFVVALFILVPVASAYDGRGGERVVIGKEEVINDDLFVGGNTVTVDGTVNGDLIAGGQTVIINGKVTGNVIAAGASVTVNGEVGHDVIAAGAAVTIGPTPDQPQCLYGGRQRGEPGRQPDRRSLFIGAGQGLVSGQITNDCWWAPGACAWKARWVAMRSSRWRLEQRSFVQLTWYLPNTPPMPYVQPGLTFGAEAHVAWQPGLRQPRRLVQGATCVSSQVTHTLPPQDQQLSRELAQRQSTSSYLFDAVRRLVALLLVGLLIAWLAPRWITGPAEKLRSRPLPSLGLGLVGLVALPFTWLVALGVIILVAVIFGLLSLGALTVLTLLAGLLRPGPGVRRRPAHPVLPVPGDRRLPGWALDPQPHPPGVEPQSLRTGC